VSRAEELIEQGRLWCLEMLKLEQAESEAVAEAMLATLRSFGPVRYGVVYKHVDGHDAIDDEISHLLSRWRGRLISGFSAHADADGSGRFAYTYPPAPQDVDSGELPAIPGATDRDGPIE
jgi:hypothetical protein